MYMKQLCRLLSQSNEHNFSRQPNKKRKKKYKIILLSLLSLKYWVDVTGWLPWEADSKMGFSVRDSCQGSFITCSCTLKGDEGKVAYLTVTREANKKLPYSILCQERYTFFQDGTSSHILGGSQSIHQNLGQSKVEPSLCGLCGYLQCHWVLPWSYLPTVGQPHGIFWSQNGPSEWS